MKNVLYTIQRWQVVIDYFCVTDVGQLNADLNTSFSTMQDWRSLSDKAEDTEFPKGGMLV